MFGRADGSQGRVVVLSQKKVARRIFGGAGSHHTEVKVPAPAALTFDRRGVACDCSSHGHRVRLTRGLAS